MLNNAKSVATHDTQVNFQHIMGIGLKLLNLLLFTVKSICLLWLSINISALKLAFSMQFLAMLMLLPLVLWMHGLKSLFYFNWRMYSLRCTFCIVATISWIEALRYMGGNDATAISFTTPIFLTILGAIICNERVNLRRIIAIVFGCIGACVIIAPSMHIAESWYGITMALISSLMWACYDIVCKIQTTKDHYMAQAFYVFMVNTLILMPFTYWYNYNPLSSTISEILSLCLVSIITILNVIVLFLAYKFAPVGLLATFSYCRVVFMWIAIYAFSGEIVTYEAVLGVAIVISSSSFIAYDEIYSYKKH